MKYSRLLLCCLLLAMLAAAPAWAKTSGKAAESVIVEECLPEAYLDSDDAFEGYFQQLLGMGSAGAFFTPRNLGGGLSGYNKLIYDRAKAMIADVAAGNRASTVFEITVEELGLTEQYTASQLGVSSIFASKDVLSEDAKTALLNKIKSSFNLIKNTYRRRSDFKHCKE